MSVQLKNLDEAVSVLNERKVELTLEGILLERKAGTSGEILSGFCKLVYADGKYVNVYIPKKVLYSQKELLMCNDMVRLSGVFKVFTYESFDSPIVQIYCTFIERIAESSSVLLSSYTVQPNLRPKSLPSKLNHIAVVSADTSDGYGDFCTRIGEELASRIILFKVPLAGAASVDAIVERFSEIEKRKDIDIVCVVRGGGDSVALRAVFDSELVCDAIKACRYPVFIGVGHSRDVTNADLVSDAPFDEAGDKHYFATPTELALFLKDFYMADKSASAAAPQRTSLDYLLTVFAVLLVIACAYILFVK